LSLVWSCGWPNSEVAKFEGLVVDDPAVKMGRRWDRELNKQVPADPTSRRLGMLRVEQFIAAGFGVATFTRMI